MEILYVSSNGTSDATKASIPWHLAVNGSAEVGQEPMILLAGDATELVKDDARAALEGVGIPPLRELVAKARDKAVPVFV